MQGLKLGHKLVGLFLIMALIVAVTGGFSIWSLNQVGTKVQNVLRTRATQEKQVVLMKTALQECRVHLFEAALVRSQPDDLEASKADYEMKRDRFRSYCDIIVKGNPKLGIPAAAKGSSLETRVTTILNRWQEFTATADRLLALKERLIKGLKPGALDAASLQALGNAEMSTIARVELLEKTDSVNEAVDDLMVTVLGLMTQANNEATEIQRKATITLIAVIFSGIILAFIFGTLATRNVVSRITVMGKALAQGANGDLTVTVDAASGDEVGQLSRDFNQMVANLAGMISKFKITTIELTQIANNINDVSRRSVKSAEIQADGVMQTSSAIVQINSSINGVAQAMDSLSLSASESSSSTMEMVASVEEVALNVETLARAVEEVSSSITEMAASIRQIDASVASLMDASLTTATSVATMDSSIKQIELNAVSNARIASDLLRDAEIGKGSVEATIAGINEIKRSSVITSEVINTLAAKATDIGAILSVIDEVAEQTNLLALNAAIIAAQAGEHGKGFAVVAEEIKDLAERTSSSTREIDQVIDGVLQETRRAVESIRLAEKSIEDGEYLSQKSGEALTKIVSGITVASSQMDQIAQTTEHQAKESQLIRRAMDKVSEMVGQIAKATNEQGRGADMIMTAIEQMKMLNAQVQNSTREQSKVGHFIGQSTENITAMIRKIKIACDEQTRSSGLIVHAVDDIQKTTEGNLGANRVTEDAVKRLTQQAHLLQQEMERFIVGRETGPATTDQQVGGHSSA
jgi:methyl-accepting chemotaxis protein